MSGDVLDQVLRFHLRVDADGRLTHLGPSLQRLLPDGLGRELRDLATTDDLGSEGARLPVDQWPGRLVRLGFDAPRFNLRGEFLTAPEFGPELLFAGTLDPDDVDRLRELGLSAADFAGSDLTMEFSMLKWTRDSQISETKSALARLEQSVKLGESLRERATTDSLTGIANRARFIEELDGAVADRTETSPPVAVIVIDVDRFKSINDRHGHQVGDLVLVSVAENLERTVGPSGLVARIGGDEFAVLVTGSDAESVVVDLSQRITDLGGRTIRHANGVSNLDLSVGMAVGHGPVESGELLRRADIAMYAGRRDDESRYGVFDPAAQHDLELRRSIADDLSGALQAGEIELYFQPIVELDTLSTSGFEVLSRWLHPEHGLVPPDLFVDVAERCQIVQDLDHYVVRNAIVAARRHLCIDDELPRLSINFSALSLSDDLASFLAALLLELDFPPSKLCVEVTETASIADLDRTARILNDLTEMGITISLDDFGTGYSSLAYLHQLPIGALKIDRSFVTAMLESQKALEVVRSIIQVAKSLELPVVAEGVETREQCSKLRNLGCRRGQGYYFANPAPAAEARRSVRSGLQAVTEGRRLEN